MPLFKRKPETLIPPAAEPVSRLPSYPRSSPNTYPYTSTASRDDAPNYSRNRGVGDVYSRGTAELDKDRNELFSGYNPEKTGSSKFLDGPEDADGEEDEDIEGIKKQIRSVKQEGVDSTSNALRLALEAEETGRNTLARLGEQHGMLSLHYMALRLIL